MDDRGGEPRSRTEKIGTKGSPDQPIGRDLPSGEDLDIRIAADGTWFHEGAPIGRKPLVKLFASVLRRDVDGSYWLRTPVEAGRIVVEDAPFTAVEVERCGAGRDQILRFRTNLDEWVVADADHSIRVVTEAGSGAPRPYVLVRDRLEALILRPVFYSLVEFAEEAEDGSGWLGVWSGGAYFTLGSAT